VSGVEIDLNITKPALSPKDLAARWRELANIPQVLQGFTPGQVLVLAATALESSLETEKAKTDAEADLVLQLTERAEFYLRIRLLPKVGTGEYSILKDVFSLIQKVRLAAYRVKGV
jgi:hypothetical protein